MTDELEGTIDISRFDPAQVNQLFGCGKHKMAATVDVHVFFQEGLRLVLFFDAEVEVCWLRRSEALAMSVGSSGD